MERERHESRVRRRFDREARLIRGATERAEMGVVPALRRNTGIGGEARGGGAEGGGHSGTMERLGDEEREQRGGGDRRDPRALRGQRLQADAAFAPPDTALRTRRFSASPSGGSFTSAVPSR